MRYLCHAKVRKQCKRGDVAYFLIFSAHTESDAGVRATKKPRDTAGVFE